jgi:hypothetical protein
MRALAVTVILTITYLEQIIDNPPHSHLFGCCYRHLSINEC